jgi:hypothetical protein
MSEDWIERTQRRGVNLYGKQMSPEELANEFAKCDLYARVDILDDLGRSDPEEMTTRQAAERMGYTRVLVSTHERLRKAGR